MARTVKPQASTAELDNLIVAAGKKRDMMIQYSVYETTNGLAISGVVSWETWSAKRGTQFHRKDFKSTSDLLLILRTFARGKNYRG